MEYKVGESQDTEDVEFYSASEAENISDNDSDSDTYD